MAVYLLQGVDGGLVKIGRADDLWVRLRQIQRFSPVELKLLAAAAGGPPLEAKLHQQYRMYRRWGEWFALPAESCARLKKWMDERPDPQRVLCTRREEIKRFMKNLQAHVRGKCSMPPTARNWLAKKSGDLWPSVNRLLRATTGQLHVWVHATAVHVDDLMDQAIWDESLPGEARRWLLESLELLQNPVTDLRSHLEHHSTAPLV
jgi:hypothetical protein